MGRGRAADFSLLCRDLFTAPLMLPCPEPEPTGTGHRPWAQPHVQLFRGSKTLGLRALSSVVRIVAVPVADTG